MAQNPYYQPKSSGGPHMSAYVDPAWYQSTAEHGLNMGVTKHGRHGAHGRKHTAHHSTKLGRRHGSPMPAIRDPFHGKAMGRNKR